jgi:hypothetical protein
MSRQIHIAIEIPYEYPERDRLTQFIGSKFPEAEISMVHQEISKPEVAEALVEYDASQPPAEIAEEVASEDSMSVMQKVTDALAEFAKSVSANRDEPP